MFPKLRLGRHSHHLCVSVPSALVQLTQATHLYGTELTAPPEKSKGRKLPHWHLKTGLVGGPGERVKGQEDIWFHQSWRKKEYGDLQPHGDSGASGWDLQGRSLHWPGAGLTLQVTRPVFPREQVAFSIGSPFQALSV